MAEDERTRQRKTAARTRPNLPQLYCLIKKFFFLKKVPEKSNKQKKGIKDRVCANYTFLPLI